MKNRLFSPLWLSNFNIRVIIINNDKNKYNSGGSGNNSCGGSCHGDSVNGGCMVVVPIIGCRS